MKYIALFIVVLAAVVAYGYTNDPDVLGQYSDAVAHLAQRAWGNIESNPIPVYVAMGTFLITVAYLRAKGKTLRESVEVAATRVTLVPVAAKNGEDEAPVVKRAKARATWAQLMADQIALQNRSKNLPEAIRSAEKDACYTEQAVADADRTLETKQNAHNTAIGKLEKLRKEKAAIDAELTAIDAELKKLNAIV